jgi:hypothetical protein
VRLQPALRDQVEAPRRQPRIGIGIEPVAGDPGASAQALEALRFRAGEEIGVGGGEPRLGQMPAVARREPA